MSDTYDLKQGEDFKRLPEISQIEVCSACNLQCPMCLRTTHLGRQPGLVDLELIKLMHKRGDFGGSIYIELQMAGEPTLHPKLWEIISYLRHNVRVLVGLSTHGLTIAKNPHVAAALMTLHALTISVDSVDPDTYHKMRYPAKLEELYENLDYFFAVCSHRKRVRSSLPMIELQLVKTDLAEKSGDVAALEAVMKAKGWDKYAVVRTIYDCFEGMQDRKKFQNKGEICLNPFTSVSVAHNGDVVSCCMIFTPNKEEINYYGNLYNNSLQEIWEGIRVHKMRQIQIHMAEHSCFDLPDQCGKCNVRSPAMIHTQIVSRLVQLRGIK